MLAIVLAAAHLEDTHLVMSPLGHDRGLDAGPADPRSADLQISALPNGQHLIEYDFLAHVRSNLFYLDLLAGGNLVLFAAGL